VTPGTDYGTPHNTPLIAVISGKKSNIVHPSNNGSRYWYVDGSRYKVWYIHTDRQTVGARNVNEGQLIGYSGTNGVSGRWVNGKFIYSSKPAAHTLIGVYDKLFRRWVDPEKLFNSNSQSSNMGTKINEYQFRVSKGGWVSQVIQEIINAKIWSGTWQANEAKFRALNPTTPTGGYKTGNIVSFAVKPQPATSKTIQNLEAQIKQLNIDLDASDKKKGEMKVNLLAENERILDQLIEERNKAALERTQLIENNKVAIAQKEIEIGTKDAQIEQLANSLAISVPTNLEDLAAGIIGEELEGRGVFQKLSDTWFDFTENFKSRRLRELLRYDLLIFIAINVPAILAAIAGLIPEQYGVVTPVLTILATLFKQEVTKRMDKNKDGTLTNDDYYVLQDYIEPPRLEVATWPDGSKSVAPVFDVPIPEPPSHQ